MLELDDECPVFVTKYYFGKNPALLDLPFSEGIFFCAERNSGLMRDFFTS